MLQIRTCFACMHEEGLANHRLIHKRSKLRKQGTNLNIRSRDGRGSEDYN